MTSPNGELNAWHGEQKPRLSSVPSFGTSTGEEAIELAAMAGLYLDDWQQYVLHCSLGERPDGSWSAFEVGVVVSRQNGKGGLLEARELAGLFLLRDERLIIHSAHQFDTSIEHFRRILGLIEDTPQLMRRVKRVSNAHGNEGIELHDGSRIRFRTRTKGGGRGFTGDLLVLDEAMDIPEATHGALLPTLSARPNPQVWYTGSAVDQEVDDNGIVFARVRERGLSGDAPRLAYFEWSADGDINQITPDYASDPRNWAAANPALGIRISPEHVANERASMSTRKFAVERLGIGDWPATSELDQRAIHPEAWANCTDDTSTVEDPVTFALDISPDRTRACIAVAGHRPDGLFHIEVIEHGHGTGWLVDRLTELLKAHRYHQVVLDGYGPAGSVANELEQTVAKNSRGKPKLHIASTADYGRACGLFHDAVVDRQLRHLGTDELTAAVDGAVTKPMGDAWKWDRKNSDVDITPLVACTLALWGVSARKPAQAYNLNELDLDAIQARIDERRRKRREGT